MFFCNINHHKQSILAWLGRVQRRLSSSHHGSLAKLENKLSEEFQEILYQEELMPF